MSRIVSALLLFFLLFGGLPSNMQENIERKYSWWHPKLFSLISSVLEFMFGLGLLRLILLMHGLGKLNTENGIILGIVGIFFLIEGLIRIASTRHLKVTAFPFMPVLMLIKIAERYYKPKEPPCP